MNKKGFLDVEVFYKLGFWILFGLAFGATIIGWKVSMGWEDSFPFWKVLVIIVCEFFAAYFFASRS